MCAIVLTGAALVLEYNGHGTGVPNLLKIK